MPAELNSGSVPMTEASTRTEEERGWAKEATLFQLFGIGMFTVSTEPA